MPRHFVKLFLDVSLWWLLTPLAFLLRLEGAVVDFVPGALLLMAVALPIKALATYLLGLHRRAWRKVGVRDLMEITAGVIVVSLVLLVLIHLLPAGYAVPRSVPVIDGMLALLALGGVRLLTRLGSEYRRRGTANGSTRRVLIAGAGESGTMAARELLRHPEGALTPVGYLDDDPSKRHLRLVGLPVLGQLADLPRVVSTHGIDEVLIAMPSEEGAVVRRVVDLARSAEVAHRTIPRMHELLNGQISISSIREVDLEDLLRREPVRLETEAIADYLADRVVLVTGAGGSIGSEIVRQVAGFGPAAIVLVGRGENSIYDIHGELSRLHPQVERHPVVTDVRDADSLRAVFDRFRPDVVFHAAAHKHVPLMEANPEQAVFNNVGGTRNLAELALEFGVRHFVNVSTDKAVNPTSVMGTTKRVAELVVHRAAQQCGGACTFVSVRFGNVLGSRGSVIPLFKRQIRDGGPVTVTHPEMTRYFMTIPEATQLVLQAGSMGVSGAVYVLDMGEPVRIVDLAHDLIKLCGKEPGDDVEITFSGIRPGEKLFEELLLAEEGTLPSAHEKLFVARSVGDVSAGFDDRLAELFDAASCRDRDRLRAALRALVPSYSYTAPTPAGDGARTGDTRVDGLAGGPVAVSGHLETTSSE